VIPLSIFLAEARSLSDIDLSTATNDAPASEVFSAKKNPQRIPANTLPVLRTCRLTISPACANLTLLIRRVAHPAAAHLSGASFVS
jgi:hypothetical protein